MEPTNRALQLIEQQNWLEPAASRLQQTVAGALSRGARTANFLHGTWLGHPLHPVLTDIPIGSWTATLVLDSLEARTGEKRFGQGADTALTLGLAGAAAAAVTGLADWARAGRGRKRQVGFAHGVVNLTSIVCYATSLALRRRALRRSGRRMALFGFVLSAAAAYLGGYLVYNERLGVDHSVHPSPDGEFVPVLTDNELGENETRAVEANGTSLLLSRRAGHIYAIGATCAHLGGPLGKGTMDAASVTCPWHGSRYALDTGRVLEGPSAHPQPSFEVRLRDGRIEVRV